MKEFTSCDAEDSFTLVELFRWQFNRLPSQGDENVSIDIPTALENMSKAIEKGCKPGGNVKDMPTPMAVCSVFNLIARVMKKAQDNGD